MDHIIKTDGSVTPVTPNNPRKGYTLEEAQKIVGGYVEVVPVPGHPRRIFIVNEEGLVHGLPLNAVATAAAGRTLVGDVLECDSRSFK